MVWLVALSATIPQRHAHTHTVLGILGPEASRVLGTERIKLPHWPVSKFRKAFKVPVAFLPSGVAGECTYY